MLKKKNGGEKVTSTPSSIMICKVVNGKANVARETKWDIIKLINFYVPVYSRHELDVSITT